MHDGAPVKVENLTAEASVGWVDAMGRVAAKRERERRGVNLSML